MTPRILGTGFAAPKTIRKNDDPIFDWLHHHQPAGKDLFTGYESRHILAPGERLIDIMKPAAEAALADAEVGPEEIDLVLGYGSMGEYLAPNTLSQLHHELGLPPRAWPLPLANEFSQFNAAVLLADALIRAERAKHILIAFGDNWSRFVSYFTPQSISAADGAAAAVIGPERDGAGWEYVDQHTIADTSYYGSMYMAGDAQPPRPIADLSGPAAPTSILGWHAVFTHPYFQITDKGIEGFTAFGLKTAPDAVKELLACHGVDPADVCLITHQASSVLMDYWKEQIQPGYYVNTLAEYANMVLASVPFNLAWAMRNAPDFDQEWLVTLCLGPDMHASAVLMRRNR